MRNMRLCSALIAVMMLSGCGLPLVDLYLVGEGGYQEIDYKKIQGGKSDSGTTYGGGLGVSLPLGPLYAGAEANISTSDISIASPMPMQGQTPRAAQDVDEKWVLHVMADAGIYIGSWLLFGRAGYVYIDSNLSGLSSDQRNAFAFGGGLEYEIGLGLGVRAYYLRHDGDREGNEGRGGIVWRF